MPGGALFSFLFFFLRGGRGGVGGRGRFPVGSLLDTAKRAPSFVPSYWATEFKMLSYSGGLLGSKQRVSHHRQARSLLCSMG